MIRIRLGHKLQHVFMAQFFSQWFRGSWNKWSSWSESFHLFSGIAKLFVLQDLNVTESLAECSYWRKQGCRPPGNHKGDISAGCYTDIRWLQITEYWFTPTRLLFKVVLTKMVMDMVNDSQRIIFFSFIFLRQPKNKLKLVCSLDNQQIKYSSSLGGTAPPSPPFISPPPLNSRIINMQVQWDLTEQN